MTSTSTTLITRVQHDDYSVRVLQFANGLSMTVADDPDSNVNYCLQCDTDVRPIVEVIVIDSEQWDYPESKDAGQPLCPRCYESDVCHADDADDILRERAKDAAAEAAFDRWHDER